MKETGTLVKVVVSSSTTDHWCSVSVGPSTATYAPSRDRSARGGPKGVSLKSRSSRGTPPWPQSGSSPSSNDHAPLCSTCQARVRPVRRSRAAPAGFATPDDHVLRLDTARRLRLVSPRAVRSMSTSPGERRARDVQRFSEHQPLSAHQRSTSFGESDTTAPVARLVTAQTGRGGLPGSSASVVVVRTAGTPGCASSTVVATRPDAWWRCTISSRSTPSRDEAAELANRSPAPSAVPS